ncbi:MAG: hypothetical protein FD175_940 [Beijerinckiaceae bacterium]|nr:MAG: hypothetical protein FD175_940 [Beijerinckiaceae bacterium]
MSDITTLEAERTRITDAIAALSPDIGRQLPGRKLPSSAGSKLDALNRQLAVVNLKLRQAQGKKGSVG